MGIRPRPRTVRSKRLPRQSVVVDGMLDVPVKALIDPREAMLAFTIENGAWSPGSKLPRYFA